MKERPILFSGSMVRALLDGRKTMTRRVVKPQPEGEPRSTEEWARRLAGANVRWDRVITERDIQNKAERLRGRLFPFSRPDSESLTALRCPFGRPGDRLWVRETWASLRFTRDWETGYIDGWEEAANLRNGTVVYDADDHGFDDNGAGAENRGFRWRPSIHMPRWASRITLEITEVRVERVQAITSADARAEGCEASERESETDAFHRLWDSLNAPRGYSWESNPWVWVLTFRRIDAALPSETAQEGR